ncbi:TolC family protein, partial [Pirellulaceae bacterium]|nr:TolC family protein [Pirellulaceae bacterium]
SDLEDEILKVQSEVDIAVRHVDISFRKLLARETAMQSAMAELQSQQERMELSLNEENLGLGLNLLLDSQDRLAEQENQLASAQSEYMISWVSLKRAMGTLVMIK